jgi:magnesium transporter
MAVMAGITLYYHEKGEITVSKDLDLLRSRPMSDFVWIDMNNVSRSTEEKLENILKIYILEEWEIEEIESSSRYSESEDYVVANSNFIQLRQDEFHEENVSFIVKNNILVSVRDCDLRSFTDTERKVMTNPGNYVSGYHILVALMATRIDYDADLIENITREISALSRSMTTTKEVDEEIIHAIKNLQEKSMTLLETIIDKQRVVSSILKSAKFPVDAKPILSIVIKDINSLIDYSKFNFERLEYLQNTFLGLVNIEQNKIIKTFTVITIIFMPPTLMASIYGMNFGHLPGSSFRLGFFAIIILMGIASASLLWFFRRKKWI